ncbi:MAG: PKD domain-containing protein, partial [Bacteroidota bacterium]
TYSYKAGATTFGPFTTSSNPVAINVTPALTTNYTLTPTVTGNGCTGSTSGSALVTVHALPVASISGNPTICAGNQTDLSVSFIGTAPYSFKYTDGTTVSGLNTTSNNPETIVVSPPTTKTYTLTLITDANCTGTTQGSALVTVNPLPTAHITGTATICHGVQTNLTIAFTGTGPFNYSYTNGTTTFGPFNTSNNSVTIPVSPTVTTTYTAVAISDANCTGNVSGNAIVTVNQLPTAVISGNPVICHGQSTTITVNFTGTAPFVYSYNDGTTTFGPFTTSSNPATIPVSPIVNTTYHLTATVTGAGCTGTTSGSASVLVHQLPSAVISGSPVICNGFSTTFNISFTGAAPFSYSYSNGSTTFGPFNTSNASETITVSPVVTTTYTLTNLSDDNCTGTVSGSALVTVHQLPTAHVTGTAGICKGNSTNLSIHFTGAAPFTYSYSNGTNTSGPFTTSNNPEVISVQPLATTTYSMTNISDANCIGTITGNSAVVTVYDLPNAVISDNSAICYGFSTTFTITFTGTAPFVYKYSDGSTVFGPFTTSSNPKVITVAPLTTKTYSMVSVNDLHCAGSVSGAATVTVNPLPLPAISGNTVICDGNSSVFSAGTGYANYLWSTSETTSSITLTTAGSYSVTVTDNNGCVSSTSQTLVVNETPVAGFSNDTSLTCEIPDINFFNMSVYPAGSIFEWDFGDSGKSTEENPSHIFSAAGTYPITLIITTLKGCGDTLTQDVDIMFYPLPVAEFKAEPTVASVFNSTVNFADISQNAITWNWTFGDGIQADVQNPKHYFDDIGKYNVKLVVTNIAGCVSEYTEPVLITPFYVPNAFTPNADGLNDVFFNSGYVLDVTSYNMLIFNRWGQKVFENNDYHKFWNGVDRNGGTSPEGTYVYTIKVVTKTGKPFEYQGTVALVR